MDNLIHADCLDAMAAMDAESIDAICTDPPYGLSFMGKTWDTLGGAASSQVLSPAMDAASVGYYKGRGATRTDSRQMQAWHEAWAREAFRIAKPGAHLLAFGGTRTVHRLAAAIEDAGWEIRDMLVWGYASGFPKSLDVSKAIDKAAGAEREVVGTRAVTSDYGRDGESIGGVLVGKDKRAIEVDITAPATPDAEKWNGWGTALKPAWEPIIMARKPLRGTVAANVLRHGTGALNIAATRIGTTKDVPASPSLEDTRTHGKYGPTPTDTAGWDANVGRWPANVILTDPIFDGGVEGVVGGGETTSGRLDRSQITAPNLTYGAAPAERVGIYEPDSGTYSRFFLIAKSARSEREPVLGGLTPKRETAHRRTGSMDVPHLRGETFRQNVHPTVKPLDLMRHLVRLVTPPGGIVLDPFLGSGTTALAAEMEGFAWIGIEKEAEYVAITEARLNGTQRGLGLVG